MEPLSGQDEMGHGAIACLRLQGSGRGSKQFILAPAGRLRAVL